MWNVLKATERSAFKEKEFASVLNDLRQVEQDQDPEQALGMMIDLKRGFKGSEGRI